MFCTKCGVETPEKFNGCPQCGEGKIQPYMGRAVIAALVTAPIGLFVLDHACKVNRLVRAGRIEEAKLHSRKAKEYSTVLIIAGVVIVTVILYLIWDAYAWAFA